MRTAERLRGGSKKGVYRLTFEDQSTVIVYVWDPAENYWPAQDSGTDGPFAEASGAELFATNHTCLLAAGVPVPHLFAIDRSRSRYPADVAFVEDVPGGSLQDRLNREPAAARHALARLGEALSAMAALRCPAIGKVALVRDGVRDKRGCARIVADRARSHLAWAAERVPRLSEVHDELQAKLSRLDRLPERTSYALIHGELGPDHVLITDRGEPVLIDIEGLMYFDVEWEHAFLRLRFGDHYQSLRPASLDEERLHLYALAMHLSLVAGPLRLLDGDFPDREPILAIAEHNIGAALAFATLAPENDRQPR